MMTDSDRKELRITQEMLFLVLDSIDEPVLITQAAISRGIVGDKVIAVNKAEGGWIVQLEDSGVETDGQ